MLYDQSVPDIVYQIEDIVMNCIIFLSSLMVKAIPCCLNLMDDTMFAVWLFVYIQWFCSNDCFMLRHLWISIHFSFKRRNCVDWGLVSINFSYVCGGEVR